MNPASHLPSSGTWLVAPRQPAPPPDYFGTEEKRALALAVARRWIGTPFVPFARVCGAGVDCVQLCGAFYIECGLVDHFTPPAYHLDAGSHRETSQVLEYIETLPKKLRLLWASPVGASEIPPVIIGDLLCFKFGRIVHHVGMVISDAGGPTPPEFLHVFRRGVACACPLDDPAWLSRLVAVYRPTSPRPSKSGGAR